MNLNMDLIADALREDFEINKESVVSEGLLLEQARLFAGGTEFLPGIVYVTRGESLPLKPFFEGHCGVVSIGPSDKSYVASASCDYIELGEGAAIEDVFNRIQETYKKHNTAAAEF